MNIGAFAVDGRGEPATTRAPDRRLRRAGAARRRSWRSAMAAFMVSLAGVPPTGGFWAKILIFRAAIDRGGHRRRGSRSIMLVNSVISVVLLLRRAASR